MRGMNLNVLPAQFVVVRFFRVVLVTKATSRSSLENNKEAQARKTRHALATNKRGRRDPLQLPGQDPTTYDRPGSFIYILHRTIPLTPTIPLWKSLP